MDTFKASIVIDALKKHIERREGILSPDEQKVRKYLVNYYFNNSSFPPFNDISRSLNIPEENIIPIIEKLDEYDVLKLSANRKEIEVFYPFSVNKTDYDVFIFDDERHFFGNCAIDALGIAFMFDCNIKVSARSAFRKEKIDITIYNKKIVSCSPGNPIFFGGTNYCSKAANSLCGALIFFVDEDEYAQWREANQEKNGEPLSLEEALYVSKIIFQNRLRDKEI